jgi:lipopolysaccharide cholinephosphotransferase
MYTQEEVRKVQKRLLEMAVTIRDILNRHKIPYFICAGTLLGAIRNKGFIPWDDDFDMYIFDSVYSKAMMVLHDELPMNLFLENEDTEPFYFHSWAHVKDLNTICNCEQFPQDSLYKHKGISIDLYRYLTMKQREWPKFKYREGLGYLDKRHFYGFISEEEYNTRKKQFELQIEEREKKVSNPEELVFCSANSKYMMRYDCILPLSMVDFEGYKFYAPHNPDEFLTIVYKNYMSLPPENKRVPHYSNVLFL